jgi:cytochrome c553
MSPIAAALSDDDKRDLAAYFSAETPAAAPGAAIDPARAAAGQRLSAAHSCEGCHAAGFVGQQQVPRLTGLSYDYLVRQMRAYKTQTRADLDLAMIMAAQPLSERDIEDLAHYILAVAGARRAN